MRDLFYRAVIQAQRRLRPGRGWPPHLDGFGIEIGAHGRPLPGMRPLYVDRFKHYAGAVCLADVLADASALPFRDSTLDYIACSHVLEHLPDPAGAIVEWNRALKPGGVLYMVVPDRRLTFDSPRQRTKVAHLIEDFERSTGPSDATHIDEFFDHAVLRDIHPSVLAKDRPALRESLRAANHESARAGGRVDIHFHVFELADVLALLRALSEHPRARLRYQLLETRQFFPPQAGNGFLVAFRSLKEK
ncbi:MAG TPA: class I SAM-dependent methyltransferase [Myxococcales bacterium]|jgi:SAM-dependent methyltransferase